MVKVYKDSKVSKHYQQYKGQKIYSPRIAITGQQLKDAGFEIGDPIRVHYEKDRIVITRLEIPTNGSK